MAINLSFFGAAGTVTGSRYLLEAGGRRILVDCGLFQGYKKLRLRNWKPFPVEPASIDAVVLTHAHIDHSGYLPRLAADGFTGEIHCTAATRDLCDILLADSAFLNEKDAERANRYGYSEHRPARPLYDRADATACLEQFRSHVFEEPLKIAPGVTMRFRRAGHILGAASIELSMDGRVLVFSGDIGSYDAPNMPAPRPFEAADVLVMESTYGDRLHEGPDPEEELAEVINATADRGGTVVIPSFAVGRAQSIMYFLMRLKQAGRIPDIPVYLDSPMAINASKIYRAHLDDQSLSDEECRSTCAVAKYTRTVNASKALDSDGYPKVIISASGMATGGRVLHHLKTYVSDARNAIVFAGFQAAGTRGAALVGGADQIKMFGEYFPVRAEVRNLSRLSAHADRDGLMRWLRGFKSRPGRVFITHGEDAAADALRLKIKETLGWKAEVPEHLERVKL